jgi:hypothetical protein
MIRAVAALLIAAVSAVAAAQAPANPPVRIRGTVAKIDGQDVADPLERVGLCGNELSRRMRPPCRRHDRLRALERALPCNHGC